MVGWGGGERAAQGGQSILCQAFSAVLPLGRKTVAELVLTVSLLGCMKPLKTVPLPNIREDPWPC